MQLLVGSRIGVPSSRVSSPFPFACTLSFRTFDVVCVPPAPLLSGAGLCLVPDVDDLFDVLPKDRVEADDAEPMRVW